MLSTITCTLIISTLNKKDLHTFMNVDGCTRTLKYGCRRRLVWMHLVLAESQCLATGLHPSVVKIVFDVSDRSDFDVKVLARQTFWLVLLRVCLEPNTSSLCCTSQWVYYRQTSSLTSVVCLLNQPSRGACLTLAVTSHSIKCLQQFNALEKTRLGYLEVAGRG